MTNLRSLAAILTYAALSACSMAPAYHVPAPIPGGAPLPAAFKTDPLWTPANPADAAPKGPWWQLFNDPVLDALEEKVVVTNQNVAAARAAWLQARALVSVDRAALFPTVSVSASATRNGTLSSTPLAGTPTRNFTAQASAGWAPDLWGKLGDTVRQAKAGAQASAADLANATLSAQATLAADYLQLRGLDQQAALQDDTVAAYDRALTITRHKYAVGTAGRADVDAAQSLFSNAQAQRRDLDRQRSEMEDAVAVLTGQNPSTFTLAPAAWAPAMPDVPGLLPAQLLQRRPDIAAAERNVSAANSGIGIARTAFFPAVSLTGNVGTTGSAVSSLFTAASSFWSLGGSAVETVLDFGANSARLRGAHAQYASAVATYRQTVLTAFEQVEDNLAAQAAFRDTEADLATAEQAASHSETIAHNELAVGTIDYITLATAKAAANGARQSLVINEVNRQSAAVALIEAIGGGWTSGPTGENGAPVH